MVKKSETQNIPPDTILAHSIHYGTPGVCADDPRYKSDNSKKVNQGKVTYRELAHQTQSAGPRRRETYKQVKRPESSMIYTQYHLVLLAVLL